MTLQTLRLLQALLESQTVSVGADRVEISAVFHARDELAEAIREAETA